MKNKDLYSIKDAIQQIKDLKDDNDFKMELFTNEVEIDKKLEILNKLNVQSEEIKEYGNKYREIVGKYAEKDASGNIIAYSHEGGAGEIKKDGQGYPNITGDKKKFNEEIKKLQDENKELLEKETRMQQAFLETLNKPVKPELKLNKIDFKDFPKLDYDQMKALIPIINR